MIGIDFSLIVHRDTVGRQNVIKLPNYQSRLYFRDINLANERFDLIHKEICGPNNRVVHSKLVD